MRNASNTRRFNVLDLSSSLYVVFWLNLHNNNIIIIIGKQSIVFKKRYKVPRCLKKDLSCPIIKKSQKSN